MISENNSTFSPLRILLVEDSEDDTIAFRRALEKGWLAAEITHFARAEEALSSLDENPPPYDLLVADYKLPGMTGLELCKDIIARENSFPCIVITGAGTENIAVEALKAGVNDYLVKDIRQSYLEILPLMLPEVVRKHRDRQIRRIFSREKEVVAAIAELFLTSETTETLFRKLPKTLAQGFAFPVAAVLILAKNQKELIVKDIIGVVDKTLLEKPLPLENTYCGQIIAQGLPSFRLNISADPDLDCFLKDSGADTCLAVPIKGKSCGVIGTLVLADFKKRPDAKIHIAAIQDIAHHLGQEIERKKVEDELREEKNFLKKLTNSLGDAIFSVKMPERVIDFANPAIENVFGYTAKECLNMETSMFYPNQAGFLEFGRKLRQTIEQKQEILFTEQQLKRKNGKLFPGEITTSFFREDGEVVRVASIIRDISERKLAVSLLQQSRKEWEKTFDAMADIVTIQDKNMRIVRANQAAYQLFQAAYGELNGKYCYEVFRGTTEPCPGCPLSNTIMDIDCHTEIMTHEKMGKIFHVSSAAIPDANGEVQYFIHTAKDITELKHLEEELFQSHKMESIGTLAGGIAHDFNNILAGILGYAEVARENIPAGSQARKDIDEVIQGGQRAADLVRQILAFSRKGPIFLKPLSPHPIVKEALKMLRSTLPTTIIIKTDIDSQCGKIEADPTQIHQIVFNLCTNAFLAMEDEKGTLKIRLERREISSVEITGETDVVAGPFIVLSVSDTGCGMDKTTIKCIFEPYFTTREVGKGSGLGLAVIHGIVKRYHGFIRVESKPEQGSSFHIYIPALEKTEKREPLHRLQRSYFRKRGSGHRYQKIPH